MLSAAVPCPHLLVAFNAPSLAKFGPQVVAGGTVIYDSSVVAEAPVLGRGVRVLGVPCAQIARDLGKPMVRNIVALGALQAATGILPAESLRTAIRQALRDKCALVPINEEAFARGVRAVADSSSRVGQR